MSKATEHTTKKNIHVRFKELDALRGIAALLVVFFHFTMVHNQYNTFFKFGTTGVDLFFIISGFVILMSLNKITKGRDFIISRISRLYPTYWAALVFTFFLLFFHGLAKDSLNLRNLLVQFSGNLTMFQFYLKIPDLDGPYWTLIVELLFYLAMLIIFKLKWLNYINRIGIIFCSLTVIIACFFYDLKILRSIVAWIPLLQFLPLFFAGTIFYNLYTSKEKQLQKYFLIFFCFLCQIALFPYAGRSSDYINIAEYSIMLTVYFGLFILFVNNYLSFCVNKLTLFLGKISYALYLIHQFISTDIIIPHFYYKLGLNFWIVAILIDLPIIIGIATLITYKVEAPLSKLIKEKLKSSFIFR